ncbi:hypothetical protein R5R35_012906 [Gryllus longicercus]|uniref:Ionotropic receptor n=1 Tax=Gryllus longicercus TaxID=2509291 RepID=A0AAN9Z7S8_9ORTH
MPSNGLYSQTNCSTNGWKRFGRHAEVMYVLASHTGNTGQCVPVDRGSVLRNGTLIGGLRDLVEGKIDVYGEPGYPDHVLQKLVDYLYPHVNDNLCLLVCRAPLKRRNLMLSLPPVVGCVIAFIQLIVVAGLRISKKANVGQAFLEVAKTFLTGSFDTRHRLLMLWISVLSFITSNVYAGCFTGSLVTPGKESEVDTLEEVYNKIGVIYTYQKTVSMFHSIAKGNAMLDAFARRLTIRVDWINATVSSNEAAILLSDFGIKWALRLPGASIDGFSLLHPVKECVLAPAYFSFPVRKHWPHQKYFSSLLQRFVEGGFMPKILAKDLHDMRRLGSKMLHIVPGMPPVPIKAISINHMREFLRTWLVGVLISSVSFLFEIATFKIRHVNK